jgi:hypothetical protein
MCLLTAARGSHYYHSSHRPRHAADHYPRQSRVAVSASVACITGLPASPAIGNRACRLSCRAARIMRASA